ncbi:RNA polymerase [Dinoroseobacter shibae DFL 12 = DSM 16493]|jgi:RNA polymerase sigma-70 factor (ECF subfamily)|uniref:RNA polymerase n=1 Tax=Dinoroseobacter shibae (strain DSM 16493 / NCIMB 14021 / DFL 12) TaxID=398580 RepID=A8LS69_DINSH|nr:sigma-70 family RNA polymerase sigma factor [Dinoroseobacter shibae]ABV94162.1 RNA polymerase [Dinoroseobacter shibae DFL 12 = DSM 16493]URF45603.1 sigma-70 family RNA polymerase sigma factor [Dinoroseobacter shibae]URF49908.1 sigma-70 family RNA polymerase sigma factor [Dinoroseobacter shibae]
MDDIDLVAQIGMGDKRAMHALYLRYNDAIYAFSLSRAGNPELASDCVHDTMLDVWRTAAKFQGRSSVKTWLFSIARNKLVDALRKRGKHAYVEDVPEVEDTAPNPEAAAIAAAERARLHHCLEGLSGPQRAAVRLAFLEELTYPEVAEIEAVPVGTIKTRIHHAKRALMRCLERGLRR